MNRLIALIVLALASTAALAADPASGNIGQGPPQDCRQTCYTDMMGVTHCHTICQ